MDNEAIKNEAKRRWKVLSQNTKAFLGMDKALEFAIKLARKDERERIKNKLTLWEKGILDRETEEFIKSAGRQNHDRHHKRGD